MPRHFLSILGGETVPPGSRSSGRLELADWLTGPANPLSARVMANRIWQHHFGRGLVATPSDFGLRGESPSHPELLDYLAARFIEQGWSIKAMHRLILNSSTYQQAGHDDPAKFETDPDNHVLWRFPRRRMSAEEIRDSLLFLSGELDLSIPSAHPFPPEKEWDYSQHTQFTAAYPTRHRSVYLMQQRLKREPFLATFDGPDPNVSTPVRGTTTTPLQALFSMNDPFAQEQAAKFAARLLRERETDRDRLALAFLLGLGRPPRPEETREAETYLGKLRERIKGEKGDAAEAAAWTGYLRAFLASNEFVHVD